MTSKYFGQPLVKGPRGRGFVFSDHRIYFSPVTISRQIDWKIYARTGNMYIRQYEEERNMTVHVIIDDSASMSYGKPSKFDYASMLGVGFAHLSLRTMSVSSLPLFPTSLRSSSLTGG